MKERPILFSAPMVRAVLGGRKTQTRRVVKPQRHPFGHMLKADEVAREVLGDTCAVRSPYGSPGDRLVVRETWQYADWTDDGMPWIRYRADGETRLIEDTPKDWSDRLTDTWASLSAADNYAIDNRAADRRWRPAIHMPRWASRITPEVTGVRVERLQDISEVDCRAEGLGDTVERAHHWYRALWEQINGPGSWDANPWVWVVEFKRLTTQQAAA